MIARAALAIISLTLTLSAAIAPARAERLIVSVSNHRVTVTPNYSGEELVLFGSVEKDSSTPTTRTAYDLVVTVSGPRADMVTRRKELKFGIWVNSTLFRPSCWRRSTSAEAMASNGRLANSAR